MILREFGLKYFPKERENLDRALLVDLYAREKSKSRPSFAMDLSVRKNEIYEFYRREAKDHRYLPGPVYEAMNARQLLNQTHLEILPGTPERWFLFDYGSRDPLTRDARMVELVPGRDIS